MVADPEVPAQPPSPTRKTRPSEQELSRLIEGHKLWLGSEGREGARAFAGPLDLCGMDLRGADLERADFTDVDLRCANLAGARITSARGLAAERLGGANLADAELPEALSGFETLQIVEELSKTSRALLVTILVVCAYCWLTIGTTMDGRLLANTGTSPLPIIQTNVPIASFYWIVPVALLAASIYLHLHLQKFWQGLASLPAIFPNAMRLEERVYPWLLSCIASRRIGKVCKTEPRFAWLETALAEFITWWLVPLTIAAFWLRYLSRHEVAGTTLHVAVFVAAVMTSLVFREAAYAELSRRDGAERRRATLPLAIGVTTLFIAAGFSALALGTRHFGVYGLTFFPDLRGARLSGESLRGVDMSHAQVTGAILDGADLRETRLNGVPFERSNLRGSKLEEAMIDEARLDNADLRDASLQGASLRKAILRGARLNEETDLHDARLEGADLRNVDLTGASLTGAHIDRTTRFDPQGLRGSDASGAIFHAMVFDRLDIRRADFTGANLEGAIFRDIRAGRKTEFNNALLRRSKFICTPTAGLSPEAVAEKGLEKRRLKGSAFDGAKLQGAEFGPCLLEGVSFKTAQMQRVTFRGTTLTRVSFDDAVLDGAQFLDGTDVSGARFVNARLNGANLTGAVHLDQDQLDDACGDAATKLPTDQTLTLKACPAAR
jgi:uncharacterized protein YjbI with pentapeptide repeats